MASIELNHAGVDIPIYNASTRSLKKKLFQAATGGQINSSDQSGIVVRALDDITLSLHKGDRLGLIGHNGAGKSTFLRLVSKVYAPTSGTVDIKGSIGSLIDINLGIDPEATGRENIFVRGGLLGMDRQTVENKIEEIIDFCELGNFIDLPLRTYSTGMSMRLAFAVSTMIRTDILVMDEWLSVGDEAFQAKAEGRMTEIVSGADILVLASHSRELISKVCNKVLWLEHSRMKDMGEPEKILKEYFG